MKTEPTTPAVKNLLVDVEAHLETAGWLRSDGSICRHFSRGAFSLRVRPAWPLPYCEELELTLYRRSLPPVTQLASSGEPIALLAGLLVAAGADLAYAPARSALDLLTDALRGLGWWPESDSSWRLGEHATLRLDSYDDQITIAADHDDAELTLTRHALSIQTPEQADELIEALCAAAGVDL